MGFGNSYFKLSRELQYYKGSHRLEDTPEDSHGLFFHKEHDESVNAFVKHALERPPNRQSA